MRQLLRSSHRCIRAVRLALCLAMPVAAILTSACARADEDAAASRGAGESEASVPVAPPTLPGARPVAVPAALGAACLLGDPSVGRPWQVQQLDDTLAVLPLVPLSSLAMRDSTRLAARITRAADVLPADTSVADFRGLPVVVRDAWILVASAQDTVVIAVVSRRLPIESDPLEEYLTLLAVPDRAPAGRDALRTVWHVRDAGAEERLETHDPVAALQAPGGALRLLLVRESVATRVVELLVRGPRGTWDRQWEGALPPCT
jgi:hypothetical protein